MFDCIIIGAGPAGATAAYHLAKKGRSVLILDKEKLPRVKPCSGGVSPAVQQWFDFDLSPAIALNLTKIRYTWKMGDPVEVELDSPMWMVKRDIFDNFLLEKALSQGATLQAETEVKGIKFHNNQWEITTNKEPLIGRYLIAADGANGPLSKWLGFKEPNRKPSLALETTAQPFSDLIANFDFGLVKNGYIFCFPKPDGYSISIANLRSNDDKNLAKNLTEFLTKLGVDIKAGKLYNQPSCLWDGDRTLHTQNALVIGDAASVADPLSGEGIRPAIFTGFKAAEAIDSALSGSTDALAKYSQSIAQEWGIDMVWASRLSGVFYQFPGAAYKAGVKLPIATKILAKILCGEVSYADIANKAIRKLMPF